MYPETNFTAATAKFRTKGLPRREQPTPTSFHSCAERLIHLRLHPFHLLSISHRVHLTFIEISTPPSGCCVQCTAAPCLPPRSFLTSAVTEDDPPCPSPLRSSACQARFIPSALLTTFTKQPQQLSLSTVVLSTITHSSSFALHHISLQHSNQALTASSHFQRNRLLLSLIQPRPPHSSARVLRISIAPPVG